MKQKLAMASLLFLSMILVIPLAGVNISKVAEYEDEVTQSYYDVVVSGNYAYCFGGNSMDIVNILDPAAPVVVYSDTSYAMYHSPVIRNNRMYLLRMYTLYILDLSNPTAPTLLGSIRLAHEGWSPCVTGDYVYLQTGYSETIDIVDISDPTAPSSAAVYDAGVKLNGIHLDGNHLYVAAEDGFNILDVTAPTAPVPVSEVAVSGDVLDIVASGGYAYIYGFRLGLEIYDISTPQSPTKVRTYSAGGDSNRYEYMSVHGGLAVLYNNTENEELEIIDISDPTNPVLKSGYHYPGINTRSLFVENSTAYIADEYRGLRIVDISDPANPTRLSGLERYGEVIPLLKDGNYLYLGHEWGLEVVDVSSPANPTHVSFRETDKESYAMAKTGTHVYVAIDEEEPRLQVYDVSNPANPVLAGETAITGGELIRSMEINGNYAYANSISRFFVFDISDPSNPVQAASLSSYPSLWFAKRGDYIYLLTPDSLKVIDVSSPTSPRVTGTVPMEGESGESGAAGISIKGKYAYVYRDAEYDLFVYDLSDFQSPSLVHRSAGYNDMYFLEIDGTEVYLIGGGKEIYVLDISNPLSPKPMGYYGGRGVTNRPWVSGGYVYLSTWDDDKVGIFRYTASETPPELSLNRDALYFSALTGGVGSPPQSVWITNAGGGNLMWSIEDAPSWLDYDPSSNYYGIDKLTLSLDSEALASMAPGTYTGTVTVENNSFPVDGGNVAVNLQVYNPSETVPPFGQFATPTDQSTVSSSVPFTGWVLDDVGVDSVKLYLVSGAASTFIGDALLVEGARPDIESAYHTYPQAYKAGWGYMMLTNFLPNGGNGTFTIRAVAMDMEGNETTLGNKTVYVNNADAVKPFGAIDTPAQGGGASGNNFVNAGWVLTPLPNSIPADGSTIRLWIDGIQLGNDAVFGTPREDIMSLFPGYSNSDGAGAYFYIDTTAYTGGVHTITWTASDSAGNADGIGSRYFIIEGGQNRSAGNRTAGGVKRTVGHGPVTVDRVMPIEVKTGFPGADVTKTVYPDNNGDVLVHIKELDHMEIDLGGIGDVELVSPLPIGASFDAGRGILYWMPGLAYVGDYDFVFQIHDGSGIVKQKPIRIRVLSKF